MTMHATMHEAMHVTVWLLLPLFGQAHPHELPNNALNALQPQQAVQAMHAGQPVTSAAAAAAAASNAAWNQNGSNKPYPYERISRIQVGHDFITIYTNHSSELLRPENVAIDLEITNLQNGQTIHRRWDGLLLGLTWGTYKVTGLPPNQWFGINFRCETNKDPHFVHTEYQVVRTLGVAGGVSADYEGLVSTQPALLTQSQRSLVTLSANTTTNATDVFVVVIRTDLICKAQNVSKIFQLDEQTPSQTVQFEIERVIERKANSTEVVAKLVDDSCYRLCWSVFLEAKVDGTRFKHSTNCTDVQNAPIKVSLRQLIYVEAVGNQLMMTTNYTGEEPEGDAEVNVNIKQLEGSGTNDNNLYKTVTGRQVDANEKFYVSEANEEEFVITKTWKPTHTEENNTIQVNRDGWFVMNYTYVVRQPLEFTDSKVTVFRILGNESDGAGGPLQTDSQVKRASDPYAMDFRLNGREETLQLFMERTQALKDYDITAKILPFCGQSGEEIALNPGANSTWAVNITDAIIRFNTVPQGMFGDNSTAAGPGQYRVEHNCDRLCWFYEMDMPFTGENKKINEECRRFDVLWAEFLNRDGVADIHDRLLTGCVQAALAVALALAFAV